MNFKKNNSERGVTTLLIIAFMGIFVLIVAALTGYAFEEAKYGRALEGREQALAVAEAGLEYYRWFLGHYPGNLTNGTGSPGPYTYAVNDPEGGELGVASIGVVGHTECGQLQWVDITSTGTSDANPGFPRKLFARYMQRSVAWYSYLLNSNVWAGSDRTITGPYFSNGGIRMDGTNLSDVLSAVSTWVCDSNYGCSPTQNSAPGVFGSGSGAALWHTSQSSIDFTSVAADLAAMKGYAQNNGGVYFAPVPGNPNNRGYHLIFKSDGTFDVYTVSQTTSVPSYSSTFGWTQNEYSIIKNENYLGNYAIPASCGLVFLEDRAWIEGTVKGKVTVVAATPSDTSTTPDAFLVNNINYASYDGTSGITVIAEGNVLIPLNAPDTMTIHGIFVAQSGEYGRRFYTADQADYGSYAVSNAWASDVLRTKLTTIGSIVSNYRTGTAWASNNGATVSGFQSRVDSYDELQATAPPPFTPAASTDYRFVLWKEE